MGDGAIHWTATKDDWTPPPAARSILWTAQRDDRLCRLAAEGESPDTIAAALWDAETVITAKAVEARCVVLGITIRRGFWTPSREARLRELWMRQPALTISQITARLGTGMTDAAISRKARLLGLPSRRGERRALAPRRRRSRADEFRAPEAGSAVTPRARVVAADFTPCPFYDGKVKGQACGAMVDRRVNKLGVKPGPYCACHAPRVLPLSKGSIGTPATYARGHRL